MKTEILKLLDQIADKRLTRANGRDALGLVLRWKVRSRQYGMIQFVEGDLVRFGGYSSKYGTWICPMPDQSPTFQPFEVMERGDSFEIVGYPVMIGDVLERIRIVLANTSTSSPLDGSYRKEIDSMNAKLVYLWANVGEEALKTSLNAIIESAEWEEGKLVRPEDSQCCCHINPPCWSCENSYYPEVPKDPNVRALCEFLLSLNLTTEK